eukprot:4121796-Alexandrium_andersonii.AAC.1
MDMYGNTGTPVSPTNFIAREMHCLPGARGKAAKESQPEHVPRSRGTCGSLRRAGWTPRRPRRGRQP